MRSKWPEIKEKLLLIEDLASEGLSEKEICDNYLGIAESTFNVYKNKHPELKEALRRGKAPHIVEIKNALTKRAKGFSYNEKKTYIKKEGGKIVEYTEITEKYCPPDVAACFIILKNKDKDENGKHKWSSNPAKLELEKEIFELRKKIEELKAF